MGFFTRSKYALSKADEWSEADVEFEKCAGFVIMAAYGFADKKNQRTRFLNMNTSHKDIKIFCNCSKVEIQVFGKPILANICHCDDCQKGSLQIEDLHGAPKILDQNGGTSYVLYRKDRVRFIKGKKYLKETRIDKEIRTRRVIAACCNSPMFLDFEPGHWISLYHQQFHFPEPNIEMHVQTRFVPINRKIEGHIPKYNAFPLKMMMKLIIARIHMMFSKTSIDDYLLRITRLED